MNHYIVYPENCPEQSAIISARTPNLAFDSYLGILGIHIEDYSLDSYCDGNLSLMKNYKTGKRYIAVEIEIKG